MEQKNKNNLLWFSKHLLNNNCNRLSKELDKAVSLTRDHLEMTLAAMMKTDPEEVVKKERRLGKYPKRGRVKKNQMWTDWLMKLVKWIANKTPSSIENNKNRHASNKHLNKIKWIWRLDNCKPNQTSHRIKNCFKSTINLQKM